MTGPRELMRLHVEALFTLDGAGRLVAVNEPGGGPAPRFFLGRTADGNAWWFRHDLSAALRADLEALCASEPAAAAVPDGPEGGAEAYVALLSRDGPVRKTWAGPAYHFPAILPDDGGAVRVISADASVLSPYLAEWISDVVTAAPMVAALDGGKAVSVCCSVRVTERAHEAGVETHPDFRGRGHAALAVAGWARAVREMGRVPLYSTSWENVASRALARKLGLIRYGVDLHVT